MDTKDKVRENRLRRMARRQGYMLKKIRRRDPRAVDYGRYQLLHIQGNYIRRGYGYPDPLTIDEVEELLTDDARQPADVESRNG